mmetsp:Transcript_83320/g.146926  ORF Transcript_83320/g.146926 Transcript_83320/m.146926 type:complete len:94 (-) Transcript_83320:809-1090(-)
MGGACVSRSSSCRQASQAQGRVPTALDRPLDRLGPQKILLCPLNAMYLAQTGLRTPGYPGLGWAKKGPLHSQKKTQYQVRWLLRHSGSFSAVP